VNSVKRTALEMAMGAKNPLPEPVEEEASAKAPVTSAKKPPQTAAADMAAAGGAPAGAGTAETIDKAKDALAPATGVSDAIDTIYATLVIIGVIITVGGILWALWARKKRRELADALDLPME